MKEETIKVKGQTWDALR